MTSQVKGKNDIKKERKEYNENIASENMKIDKNKNSNWKIRSFDGTVIEVNVIEDDEDDYDANGNGDGLRNYTFHKCTLPEKRDQYQCSICNKTFGRKYTLKMHMICHESVHSFKCSVCGNTFKRKSDLTKHMHSHKKENFPCKECSKVFARKDLLNSHMKNVHGGRVTLQCKICLKTLTTASGLRRHLLTHSGECTFECDVCHKRFRWREVLKKHMRYHFH